MNVDCSATVYGLWVDAAPYRVSSGYITKDTKVVFACLTILGLLLSVRLDRLSLTECLLHDLSANVQRDVGL